MKPYKFKLKKLMIEVQEFSIVSGEKYYTTNSPDWLIQLCHGELTIDFIKEHLTPASSESLDLVDPKRVERLSRIPV
ncbi:MAG: hypothetical protein KKD77_21420 [Gammaproteobacteria bacterium]|nr:hypothetical protein [Gammaproteobacteria bacterium]